MRPVPRQIDCGGLRASLRRLEAQHENYERANLHLSGLERQAVAESVVRRFGISYDRLWKVLRRHLVEALGMPEAPRAPKPLFRFAHRSGLLASPVEQWLRYCGCADRDPV